MTVDGISAVAREGAGWGFEATGVEFGVASGPGKELAEPEEDKVNNGNPDNGNATKDLQEK